MSEILTVIAQIRAKAGQRAPLRQVLLGLVTPTRAEAGCVCYDLHESSTEPGLFVFYETWKTEADLDAHFQTPHMVAFQARISELVEGAIELTKCTRI
jgi:quinol monooxygenase YgiN